MELQIWIVVEKSKNSGFCRHKGLKFMDRKRLQETREGSGRNWRPVPNFG